MKYFLALVAIAALQALPVLAQKAERQGRGYPPEMPGAEVETYKTVGETQLKLYVFKPDNWQPDDERPAIVFFFGGGWTGGSPQQFRPHCEYLASRGMVAIAADYRVASRHQVKAIDCVKDAKSAIRFVRKHADRLGIDPDRIVAAGGSAGGHLAATCGTIAGFDEPDEDSTVSSRPNAMLLFNPAVVLAAVDGIELDERKLASQKERMGTHPRDLSPYHHVASGAPPTAIFHGTADTTVPYGSVVAFTKAMQAAGNTCELYSYEDEGHGFFNYGRAGNKMFLATLGDADRFLTGLGYLQGEPTLEPSGKKRGKP